MSVDTYKTTGFTWIANFWGNTGFGVPVTVPTVANLKSALYQNGPIVVSFEVFSDFYNYKSGIYSFTRGYDVGGHIVLLVGYDDSQQCFIVKNSWGPGWGEGGFFRIAYSQTGQYEYNPYWTGSKWYFYGPYFGGYALAYNGAVPPTFYSNINYPTPGILSKKILGKAVCTITGTAGTESQKYLRKVEVSTDSGATWHAAKDTSGKGTLTSWSYNWPLPKDGTYTLFPMATDSYTNTQGAGITVMVDNTAPASVITAPATGPLPSGASYLVTGTATDNLSGVTGVEVSTDGGKTWKAANITSGSGTTSATWNYSWTLSDGAYTIKSRATDIAHNVEKPLALMPWL